MRSDMAVYREGECIETRSIDCPEAQPGVVVYVPIDPPLSLKAGDTLLVPLAPRRP